MGAEGLARDVFLLAQQGLNAGLTGLSAHLRGKDLLAFQRECANLHNTHMKGTLGVEGRATFMDRWMSRFNKKRTLPGECVLSCVDSNGVKLAPLYVVEFGVLLCLPLGVFTCLPGRRISSRKKHAR